MLFLLLLIGFLLLIKGADILVDSSSKLAKIYGISPFIIGLSIIAFGTSAPELAIGIFSAVGKANEITLGDVIGSCIANITLIIGVTSILLPIKVNTDIIKKEIPLSFMVQVLLLGMVIVNNNMSRLEGVLLLILFLLFIWYIIINSKKNVSVHIIDIEEEEAVIQNSSKSNKTKLALFIFLGLIGLVVGANLVVNSSIKIAAFFGLNTTLIGLTVVAFGTSLPELVTSIVAVVKKHNDIAIGNIIGSNIFNILAILGVSSTIHPISILNAVNFDIFAMLFSTLLLFAFSVRTRVLSRADGLMLSLFYFSYISIKILTI